VRSTSAHRVSAVKPPVTSAQVTPRLRTWQRSTGSSSRPAGAARYRVLMSEASLKIGEVARRTGLSVRTLRHYDELGLLVPSERTYSEHRLYSSEDFRRLLAVQHLKSLGLSLTEVKAALDDPGFDAAEALAEHITTLQHRLAAEQELFGRLRNLQGAAETGWEEILTLIALTERLSHREPTVRLRAALDASSTVPLSVLVENLAAEADPGVQGILVWAIVQHRLDAVPLVTEHLGDQDPAVRVQMSFVLAKLADPRAVPALVPLLGDLDPQVASSAAFALGRIGGPDALSALIGRLSLGSGTRGDILGDAIARFGDLAIGPLTGALSTGTQDVREHAAAVLGFIGSAEAAPALAGALADADADVRLAALVALGHLRGQMADAAIGAATDSGDPRVRTLAARLTADRTPPPAAGTR
jgi:DNA-binding transcriptional MerR regulator